MKNYFRFVIIAILCSGSSAAQACSSCFGASDSRMAQGMNAGIFALLAFVAGFWLMFGTFFVFIARRSRQVNSELPGVQDDSQHN